MEMNFYFYMFHETPATVSYTHLDVYKRQTVLIAKSLYSLGIQFLDHIIVSDNEFYSFTAENLIHKHSDTESAYHAQYADWSKSDEKDEKRPQQE